MALHNLHKTPHSFLNVRQGSALPVCGYPIEQPTGLQHIPISLFASTKSLFAQLRAVASQTEWGCSPQFMQLNGGNGRNQDFTSASEW